ncbi:hypothetical protein H7I53_23855 [Mycolicibacterium pulveris]|uniref:Uncharacterized protein n=1 Tax=Mycolicibacterium pulveris TaxID=36813 RepID=A0A7I7URB8_MYCPV|nr:hypothetical protein [Mycolicibacterium pulveris]MCV6983237.1 hypothetical protein [Mycolicibacterium pulveris]BBY83109.1 hypothetical protein MPUL_42670 [Mycolicibacterium pulveris]
MGAPLEFCSKRSVVAVLASGIVISLTALTGGIAPALAQPDSDDSSGPTTTVMVPQPKKDAPEPKQEAPRRQSPQQPAQAPAAEAPQTQAPQPQTQAPKTQTQAPAVVAPEPEPQPQTQAPQPQTQAPQTQTQAPKMQTQAPQTQTQAPKTAVTTEPKTAVTTEPGTTEPAPTSEAKPSTAAERSPAGSAAPSTESQAARTTEADRDAPQTSGTSVPPSEAMMPATETSDAPSSRSEAPASESETSESKTNESNESEARSEDSETPTVSISQAAKEIETLAPKTLEAPVEDVQLAKSAEPIFEPQPEPAAAEDVAAFANSIETSLKIPGLDVGASAKTEFGVERRIERREVEFISNVRQWRPEWIEYDEYYRPIIANPFRAPVRIVYVYDMRPRIMYIPPLSRIVLEAARFAAYSFTAAILAPVNAAIDTTQAITNIAVGSFFGGGYYPGVGVPLPPPPPPVLRYDNVPVQVRYSDAVYEPFRVRRIVDVGEDARFGERKVLLDGATPAWGVWTQTPSGERQFEVHRTQQFPGLEEPQEGPLPGDYRLRLASDESSSAGLTGRDVFLMVAAGVIGTLGFGAIGMAFYLGRRRPEH